MKGRQIYLSKIYTPKKLVDLLTTYAIEKKADKEKSSTLLAAAQMIKNRKQQLDQVKGARD